MREPLPLARIQETVLQFLRHRQDAVLFGAQAVNAYVDEPRMTQDVDVLSTRAGELAEELRAHLAATFAIAVRVRDIGGGRAFRLFQLRKPKNRHLVDVRLVEQLPPSQSIADVRVPIPEELIAQKVISAARRKSHPKGDTDRRDIKVLLLAYPHLKTERGPVLERLKADDAENRVLQEWRKIAGSPIDASDTEESDEW